MPEKCAEMLSWVHLLSLLWGQFHSFNCTTKKMCQHYALVIFIQDTYSEKWWKGAFQCKHLFVHKLKCLFWWKMKINKRKRTKPGVELGNWRRCARWCAITIITTKIIKHLITKQIQLSRIMFLYWILLDVISLKGQQFVKRIEHQDHTHMRTPCLLCCLKKERDW